VIVDFTDVELQQSDVVPTEEECLADEVLHLDTMMPDLSNVPASTPAETPRSSSIKRKRQQEDPRIEEAFRILKKANKNMENSSKEDMQGRGEGGTIDATDREPFRLRVQG
ncbi:hypothetical protein AVEN_267060-1, partial [Araneus ventricosus]